MFVIPGEPVYMVLEGVEGGGCDDARLTHTTPEGLASSAASPYGLLVTREHRRGAGLVDEDVGTFVQEHLFSAVRVDVDPNLVGHRPGRRVQCSLLAQQVRHVLLEPVYSRVLTKHVVPNRRLEHRPPHALRRTGHRVAAKIYQGSPPLLRSAAFSTLCVVAKWIFATSARPSSPNSPTTRRPASTTCVAPSGNPNPTRSERRPISSSCRARAT